MKFHPVALTSGALITLLQLQPVLAEDADTIIVTANRSAETVDETLASVSVITRTDIENSQARSVMDLLSAQAGVDVTRNGGPGSATSIFLRGTNSNQTLVLIDGVRASSATTGGFAWQNLSPTDIERIEIVRGPRAAQYGADTIGGVIQIFTRKNRQLNVRVQGGSYNTKLAEVGFGGGNKVRYSVNFTANDSDSFSSTNAKAGYYYDPDNDGYKKRSFSGNVDVPVGEASQLSFKAWYSDNKNAFDKGISDAINATIDGRFVTQTSASWKQTFQAGLAQDDVETSSSYPSRIKTDRLTAYWQNDLTLNPGNLLSLGLSGYQDKADNSNPSTGANVFNETTDNKALFAIWQGNFGKHDLNASARVDDYSSYGSHATGQIAWGMETTDKLRLTASYGTAFRTPTINELYYPNYGNQDLKPEDSDTLELGLRYRFSQHQNLKVSAYRTNLENLIEAVEVAPFIYQAENIGKARIDGLELTYDYTRTSWGLIGNLTFMNPINKDTGEQLIRRAREKLNLQYLRFFSGGSTFGVEWEYASKRHDRAGFPSKTVTLDAYNLFNLSSRIRMDRDLWFEMRVDNIFNAAYELVYGYNTPGASFYAGINYVMPN